MHLDEVKNLKHEDDFEFAIAVGYEGEFTHCAILYKWTDGRIRTLEFTSDQHITNSHTIGDFGFKDYIYIYYNKDQIIDPIAEQVPSVCDLIKENNSRINFGIRFTETYFDANGKLIYANGDYGLTCATFVLALFKRAGINLIDKTTWRLRESDSEWQKRVLNHYERINHEDPDEYSDELLKYYKESIPCFRYRPEEVAAASASETIPADFHFCEDYGERIVEAVSNGSGYYYKIYF